MAVNLGYFTENKLRDKKLSRMNKEFSEIF